MTSRLLALTIGLMLAVHLSASTSAGADGLPLPVTVSPDGVTTPGGEDRYVTLGARRGTVVARVQQDGGEVIRSRPLEGEFTVPAVAYDGSPSGLSADGRTLVLIRPRRVFPQRSTTFAVLGTQRLDTRELVTLPGDFSFDAISPDGSRVYLIEYLSRSDPTRYEVRAYDTRAARLLPKPIVDPNEPPGEMRGYPITRAVSPAGRWAYTLYDGGGDHPFIHALDTLGGRAVCIDVHALADRPGFRGALGNNAGRFGLALSGDGGELTVLDRDVPVAYVDTRTFEVSEPTAPADGGGFPWAPVILAAAAFVAAALTLGLRRRRHDVAPGGARQGPPEPTGS
jgi:DNA-binding beta-propeller fold protein YncE